MPDLYRDVLYYIFYVLATLVFFFYNGYSRVDVFPLCDDRRRPTTTRRTRRDNNTEYTLYNIYILLIRV